MKWREFWDSFLETIDKNKNLADIDKFKYLKSYLAGDALKVCEGYTLSSANYQIVKAALEDRFGDPQLAIFSHLTAIIEHPVASHSVKDLQKIYDECEKHVRSLVGLGLEEEQYGLVFTPIILSKLPLHVKMELHRQNGSTPWTLGKLRELLRQEIRARDMNQRQFGDSSKAPAERQPGKPPENNGGRWKGGRSSGAMLPNSGRAPQGPNRSCQYCSDTGHRADQCTRYATYEARRDRLGSACLNCLGKNHTAKICKSKSKCAHSDRKGHHSSLCFSLFPDKAKPNPSNPDPNKSGLNGSASPFVPASSNAAQGVSDANYTSMQTAVAPCFTVGKHPENLRMLFDTAGFRSYITVDSAKKIGARKVDQETLFLGVFEDKRRRYRTYDVVEFSVTGKDGSEIPIRANVTEFITCPVYNQSFDKSKHPIFSSIPIADPAIFEPRFLPVDILIGGDHYYDLVTNEQIRCADGLVLLSSKLGYLLAGVTRRAPPSSPVPHLLLTSAPPSDACLDLERFWRIEDLGIKDAVASPDEESTLQHFSSSVQFENGMYFVKWPQKPNACELPDNRELAFGRLKSLIRRLSVDPNILNKYGNVITDQFDRGIIELAPSQPTGQVHYLPHHGVLKPQSLTTPVRVVYDASARAKRSYPSLNDTLYSGPLFLADLVGLLLRFRLHPIAVVSDIEKAFLHIGLQESERDLVRFFWVKNPHKPATGDNLLTYRFCRVPFGLVCSSFLLAACLLRHLSQYQGSVARLLEQNLYVDNVIVSFETLDTAVAYYKSAKAMLSDASMNLRQWFSNCLELNDTLSEKDRGSSGPITQVLGMRWDTSTDQISISPVSLQWESVSTKRHLVQAVAKFYDPCGLFSPIITLGKILVQQTWALQLKWDDPLPSNLQREWAQLGPSMSDIPSHRLSRMTSRSVSCETTRLHCFCDASTKCYAAAIYIQNGAETPTLVFSKTRLAPLKSSKDRAEKPQLTIPQLELLAIWIGARMLSFVSSQLELKSARHFIWSDSQCALHWVLRHSVCTTFVKNRVKEIHRITQNVQFDYVRSEDNPADVASRGCYLDGLIAHPTWWHGPQWLRTEEAWPNEFATIGTNFKQGATVPQDDIVSDDSLFPPATNPVLLVDAEVVDSGQSNTSVLSLVDCSRFSSLTKLQRVLAWVCRFVLNCRQGPDQRTSGDLQTAEVARANLALVLAVQQGTYFELISGRASAKARQISQQLSIQKDSEGILRCHTRLELSDLDFDTKYPVLLPPDHAYTKLVVIDTHCRLFHAGVSHCLSEARQKYWIPRGRSQVKKAIGACKLCKRLNALRFKAPPYPPLPKYRATSDDVFAATGLDYLGPLLIRTPNGEQNVWMILFTCTVVRAIHLEVVEDMTVQQFLYALRRFSAIYGTPKLLVSDNAKQFKATDKIFDKICRDKETRSAGVAKGIEWKFITERAPWFGGFYERLVGLVKKSLRAGLNQAKVTLTELQTLALEVASCLNSRPITFVDSDLNSLPLSPANFLLKGKPTELLDPGAPDDRDADFGHVTSRDQLLLKWRRNTAILQRFWKIWSHTYLTGLKEMHREWKNRNSSSAEPEIGMTVLIADQTPRGQWKLGRISAVHRSSDGQIRSAEVTLPSGLRLLRPVKLLCPLETSASVSSESDTQPTQPQRRKQPIRPALTYPKTVLAVTDSFGRPIGEIEGGDIYAYSGATFRKLMNTLHPMNINFCDYRFVIIHCGINDIQRGRQWAERSFTEMLSYLRSVQIERNGFPAGNILISCPLLHPRIPQAADYSNFIQTAAEPHGLTVLNWAQGSTNPFVEDLEWRDRTSASDQFHVNHAGTRSLWKAWCDKFPSMRVVSYRLEKERVPAHPPANAGASAGPVAGPSWQ